MNKVFRLLAFNRLQNSSTIIRCYSGEDERISRRKRTRGKNPGFEANVGLRHKIQLLQHDDPAMDVTPKDLHFDEDRSDEIIFNAGRTYDQYLNEEKFRKNRTMMQIVKRKYFKDVSEPCFLTYAAKEQLRYLRESDPETWTFEKLAESFPITVTGVKKLLKRKQSIYTTDEDILNHDKKVFQNWKMLKGGEGGPLSATVSQKLLENFNVEAMTGNKNLPAPTDTWRQRNVLLPSAKSVEKPVGEFERMIVDYKRLSVGKKERDLEEKKKRAMADAEQETLHEVALSGSNIIPSPRKQLDSTFEVFKEKLKKQMPNAESDWRKMKHMERRSSAAKSNETEIEIDVSKYRDILNYFDGKIIKEAVDPKLPNLRWGTPRGAKSDRMKEAYIYHPDRGYQHPLGRYEDLEDQIEAPPALKNTSNKSVRQKDEDGNFPRRNKKK